MSQLSVLTSGPPTKDAAMLLRRADMDAVPTPTLRISVGNSSLANTYSTEYVMQMRVLPSIAHTTVAVS